MRKTIMPLNQCEPGISAKVLALRLSGQKRRRMLDLGVIPETTVQTLQKSPSGDPIAYLIKGAVIALRSEEAGKIIVESL